jgi:hypothetical protein
VPRADRDAVQAAARAAALVVVVAWLFVEDVRAWLPIWLPLVLLGATELEFVLRGRGQLPGRRRVAGRPGPEDADLGFGEFVEEEDGYRYVPPPPRPPRRRGRRLGWLAGAAVAAVLVALAVRSDRAATWQGLPEDDRATAEARFQAEARRIAGGPVRVRCDDGYAFTGAGSDTLGVAFPARALAYLDPTVCRSLRDVSEGSEPGERGMEAVVVLAHEAVHLRGERREGVTECLALQEAGPLAARLGLSEERARALVRAAYERRLAERNVIRAAYALPTSCRDGGGLDRSPGDGRFP